MGIAGEEAGTLALDEGTRLSGSTLLPGFVWVVLHQSGMKKVKLITAFNQISKIGY